MKLTRPRTVAELLAHPEMTLSYIDALEGLLNLNLVLVPPGNNPPLAVGQVNIQGTPPKLFVMVPLQFSKAVADVALPGGTAVDTVARTKINEILAELRKNKQNPG